MPGVEGRVALVTGGAQGIGAAVARQLAAGGARVAVLDLQQEAAAEMAAQLMDAGGSALGIGGDVSRREDVQAAVDSGGGPVRRAAHPGQQRRASFATTCCSRCLTTTGRW